LAEYLQKENFMDFLSSCNADLSSAGWRAGGSAGAGQSSEEFKNLATSWGRGARAVTWTALFLTLWIQ